MKYKFSLKNGFGSILRNPIAVSLFFSFVAVGLVVLIAGVNPISAYVEIWRGATTGSGPKTVINRAIPIIGMALALSIPFRTGIVNLGGEGQMVIGGLAAALTAIFMPGPGFLVLICAMISGVIAGMAWSAIPALLQVTLQLPILISSLLLNVPGRALTGYLVKYYFKDPVATSNATVGISADTRIPTPGWMGGAILSAVFVIIAIVIISKVLNRTVFGYESRISGINLRFSRYGGVDVKQQTLLTMLIGGGIAGAVGAHLILGQAFRFVDGDLAGTGFAWTGLLVTLLVTHKTWPILIAGIFFAALQVGGLAMQRSAGVSWQLAQVLQAVVILSLTMRIVISQRRTIRSNNV